MASAPCTEQEIRSLWLEGDVEGAATATLRLYGPEVFGFLVGMLRSEADASDVFSAFSERLWRTLARFAWGCSLRTWSYLLARNEALRFSRGELQRRARNVPISQAADVAEKVRTETLPFLKDEVQGAVEEMRAALSPDDRALLILRVDRQLSWEDVARAFVDEDGTSLDEEALRRESARLRKRFQLVKGRILEMARVRGVVPA